MDGNGPTARSCHCDKCSLVGAECGRVVSRATWHRHQQPQRRRLGRGSALDDGGGPADGDDDGRGDGDRGGAAVLNDGNLVGDGETDDGGQGGVCKLDLGDGGQGGDDVRHGGDAGGDDVLGGDDVGGGGALDGTSPGLCSGDEYDDEALGGPSGADGSTVDPSTDSDESGASSDSSSAGNEFLFAIDDDDLHHDADADAVPHAAPAAAAVPVNKVRLSVDEFVHSVDDFVAYTFFCTHSMTRAATEDYLRQRSRLVMRRTPHTLRAFINASST